MNNEDRKESISSIICEKRLISWNDSSLKCGFLFSPSSWKQFGECGRNMFHSRWFFFLFRCPSFRKRLVSTLILKTGSADECFFVLFDHDWRRRKKLLSWRMPLECLVQSWSSQYCQLSYSLLFSLLFLISFSLDLIFNNCSILFPHW